MIAFIFLSLFVVVPRAEARSEVPDPALLLSAGEDVDDDVEAAIRARGTDVEGLLRLADTYEKASKAAAVKRVYERVIELDSDNERARGALRHHRYDGRWFESYVELARYKREEESRMKAKGLVRWQEGWVPEADLAYVRMGWERNANQDWKHPAKIREARQIEEWKAAGYQFRADDSSWIAPGDVAKWSALLWKCGDQWLDQAAADAYHAGIDTAWRLTGAHFDVLTTCPWSYGNAARWHADSVHDELVRIFGSAPTSRPELFVLNSLKQYNEAAAGRLVDSDGFSSLHGAYFSDGALDVGDGPDRYSGFGVCYWEAADPGLAPWGPFWVRWAAAQSFVEGLDPSWDAVSRRIAEKDKLSLQDFGSLFWKEKRIPRWLRYGAAAYVERFLRNPEAAEGSDPWTLRAFAFSELAKGGGLREPSVVFAFPASLEDIPGSTRLYSEAGLLVSFLLDGSKDDAELQAKHAALRAALSSGTNDEARAAAKALEAALTARSDAIRAFAGL